MWIRKRNKFWTFVTMIRSGCKQKDFQGRRNVVKIKRKCGNQNKKRERIRLAKIQLDVHHNHPFSPWGIIRPQPGEEISHTNLR